MRKFIGGAGAMLVAVVALGAALWSGGDTGPEVELVGYFKDAEQFRVMAYRADASLTRDQAEAALKGVMHSNGAMTWAVIYGPGDRDPGHALSALERRADALEMIGAPPFDGWDWHLSIRHDGLRTLRSR